jgi:hypothetical protein
MQDSAKYRILVDLALSHLSIDWRGGKMYATEKQTETFVMSWPIRCWSMQSVYLTNLFNSLPKHLLSLVNFNFALEMHIENSFNTMFI